MARKGGAGGIILVAIIFGIVTAYLIYRYEQKRDAQKQEHWLNVVVASEDILPRVKIRQDQLRFQPIPKELLIEEKPLTNFADVVGRSSLSKFRAKEQIRSTDLLREGEAPVLAYKVPSGMRAVAIGGDEVRFVGTGVEPGDHVDIIATYFDPNSKLDVTKMVLQNILVLAINRVEMEASGKQGALSSMTLAVTPENAELLKAAERLGTMCVTLRANLDKAIIQSEGYHTGLLANPAKGGGGDTNAPRSAVLMTPVAAPAAEIKEVTRIKVIRGTEERTVTLGESH